MWWQILLVLAAWIVCSLLFGVVWALGHRDRRPHRCRACAMPKERGPLMKSTAEFRVPLDWTLNGFSNEVAQDVPMRAGRGYGGYGQKPATVQAPVPTRVISPIPKAPPK